MRVGQVDRFRSETTPYSAFIFVKGIDNYGDVIFTGSEKGLVSYILFPSNMVSKNIRIEDFSLSCTNGHKGAIECLMSSFNDKLSHSRATFPLGILFSGGRDQTIKVWNPASSTSPLIQSLIGHGGVITSIVDGHDGSLISTSSDGTIRIWTPQAGRGALLNPYFEVSHTISTGQGKEIWYLSAVVSHNYTWTCYVSNSAGDIEIFRKNSILNDFNAKFAGRNNASQFNQMMSRFRLWESVHNLGITDLSLIQDDEFLVSLSGDCSCKVLDSKLGNTLFHINNNRMVRFKGVCWTSDSNKLFLTDEMGYLDVFSISLERITDCTQLIQPTVAQRASILSSHRDQALGDIVKFKDSKFIVLLPRTAGADDSMGLGAGSGEISVWQIEFDNRKQIFAGHESDVLAISLMPSKQPRRSNLSLTSKSSSKFAAEERLFFSVGMDNSIRCWDEFDKSESYQFRSRGLSGVTAAYLIWDLNSIATGHEDGTVAIWNTDSGNKVSSKVHAGSITCFVESKSVHSRVLLSSDSLGKLASWNLTLFEINPIKISLDSLFQGCHDRSDPCILSLTYNWKYGLLLSGGEDCSIRYWRLASEGSKALNHHSEPVCTLDCVDDFLLSGDQSGDMILWKVSDVQFVPICRWTYVEGITRALGNIYQIGPDSLMIVQGGLFERVKIWEVNIQKRNNYIGQRKRRVNKEDVQYLIKSLDLHDLDAMDAGGNNSSDDEGDEGQTEGEVFCTHLISGLTICHQDHRDKFISVKLYRDVSLENDFEANCCQLGFSGSNRAWVADSLYVGSTEGKIMKLILGSPPTPRPAGKRSRKV